MKMFNSKLKKKIEEQEKLLEYADATITAQSKKLVELTLQLDEMRKENMRLKEQNSRLNHFVDIQLGIKDIDYPDVIKN